MGSAQLTHVTTDTATDANPSWSGNGAIFFDTTRTGGVDLYRAVVTPGSFNESSAVVIGSPDREVEPDVR